jgi:hypothetical protein
MTVRTSVWRPYQPEIPTHASALPLDIIRTNISAVHVATACGISPMWSYTNSVTRAEAAGGTAAQPARKYWYRGTGNTTKWVKAAIEYTLLDITQVAFYYSEDNESTYVPMLDPDRNYVLTLTYDGANNLESTSWGNVA